MITIKRDDTATSKISTEDAIGVLLGCNATRLQVLKRRMQKLDERGKLRANSRGDAVGERSWREHHGSLILNPTPLTVMRWKN